VSCAGSSPAACDLVGHIVFITPGLNRIGGMVNISERPAEAADRASLDIGNLNGVVKLLLRSLVGSLRRVVHREEEPIGRQRDAGRER
jgi:hypothetical protein